MSHGMKSLAAVALAGLSLFAVACEEKAAPPKPPAGGTPASKPAGEAAKEMTEKGKEAVQQAAEKGKEAVKDAADKAKEAVQKPVEEAKKAADSKVAEVSQAAKDAFGGYLSEMGSVNTLLEKVKGPMDVTSALPTLGASSAKINGYTDILGKLSPEQKTAVIGDKKDALSSLTATFKAQMDRLTKDPMLGKLMGDPLKKFKLFE